MVAAAAHAAAATAQYSWLMQWRLKHTAGSTLCTAASSLLPTYAWKPNGCEDWNGAETRRQRHRSPCSLPLNRHPECLSLATRKGCLLVALASSVSAAEVEMQLQPSPVRRKAAVT